MKTLIEAAVEFERSMHPDLHRMHPDEGSPFVLCPARTAFMAGAAAMAEQFAQDQGTVLQLIRDLAEIQTRNAQLLAERLRELNITQRDIAGFSDPENI